MIDRRTFIRSTALFGTATALANLLPLSSTGQAHASPLPNPLPAELAAGATNENCVTFKIDGWNRWDDIAIAGSEIASADLVTDDPAGDYVWMKINQSWRTTWR